MPAYLVERNWPGVTIERLLQALDRGRRLMEEMSGKGVYFRHINTILLPGEEVVFSVYNGSTAAAVGQLNERAGPLSAASSTRLW